MTHNMHVEVLNLHAARYAARTGATQPDTHSPLLGGVNARILMVAEYWEGWGGEVKHPLGPWAENVGSNPWWVGDTGLGWHDLSFVNVIPAWFGQGVKPSAAQRNAGVRTLAETLRAHTDLWAVVPFGKGAADSVRKALDYGHANNPRVFESPTYGSRSIAQNGGRENRDALMFKAFADALAYAHPTGL